MKNINYLSVSFARKLGIALLAFVVALSGSVLIQQATASSAAADDAPVAPTLSLEAYYMVSSYKGVAVDISAKNVPDADEVRVILHRSSGGDVVKTSRAGGSAINWVRAGSKVTAPIVVQQGTYDEIGSGSWHPANAIWTNATVPTGVTVQILQGGTVIVQHTLTDIETSNPFHGIVTLEDVMPLPAVINADVYFSVGAKYKGIGVDVWASNVTDATAVRVIVHRTSGGDVIKESKASGSVPGIINSGAKVTAPIVIEAIDYDEAGSSSWVKPDVTWTPDTVPTSVTVVIERSGGADLVLENQSILTNRYTADDVMPVAPTLGLEAYYMSSPYKGVAVNVSAKNITDADQVRVIVHRSSGGDVVKTSKAGGSAVAGVNAGNTVTAPIIVQQGTYNEAASGSWHPATAIWTNTTVPTGVTVQILRGGVVLIERSLPGIESFNDIVKLEDIMPASAPTTPIVVDVPTDSPVFNFEIPAGVPNVELNLGAPSEGKVTIPVEVAVSTNVGVNVTFPANTKVTSSDPDWDGAMQMPTVKTDVEVPTASGQKTTVGVAIQLGSPTARIDFDAPVKLVLAGQAGKSAAYVQFDVFHVIANECPAGAPADMGGNDECWLNDGDDLVIWTTHFTTFLSYVSEAATGGSSGSSGGSGSSNGGGSSSGGSGDKTTGAGDTDGETDGDTDGETEEPVEAEPIPTTPPVAEEPGDAAAPGGTESGGFDASTLLMILIPLGLLLVVGAGFGIARARRAS